MPSYLLEGMAPCCCQPAKCLGRSNLSLESTRTQKGLRGTCASQSGTRTVFQRLYRSSARESSASCDVVNSDPQLLSVRALNEVFVGESLSSRASYYEISIDDGPWEKHKNSGLNMCTGTGSKAWSYNINKLAYQEVEDLLSIAKEKSRVDLPINQELVEQVTDHYNQSLIFCPEDPKIFFSIREPIVNRVFTSSQHRGFTNKMSVRSRCWDACMVVDGGTSFEFNDGAIATLTVNEEDALCTVVLEDFPLSAPMWELRCHLNNRSKLGSQRGRLLTLTGSIISNLQCLLASEEKDMIGLVCNPGLSYSST
ncbi:hypothetical protein chiPu_0020647 [Chiloscyllium punctatum]|uniref:NAD(+) kinase n=1 Tax=Chiloscyllium punctatum TaxID=137246 RepID=A0A401RHX3_CHIPU|nr:hypothetical protein [Chiloscyllium punctatum]